MSSLRQRLQDRVLKVHEEAKKVNEDLKGKRSGAKFSELARRLREKKELEKKKKKKKKK